MDFILRMAYRELRASWRRLIFFFCCVAIGVGGIVALRSLVQNVRAALAAEARGLTAGDVYVRTDQPWSEEARGRIEARAAEVAGTELTETVDTVTMARLPAGVGNRTKVVEVRGVEPAFPFYGRFTLESGAAYAPELLRDRGALVGRELLPQLGVAIGDQIRIGDTAFTIRDAIVTEPGRQLGGFSLGPRVLVAHEALAGTGLLGFASRAERQLLLRVPDEEAIEPLVRVLREDLREEFVRLGSYRRTENRIERNFSRAENYLSLIGFVIVILGGIGVWSVTRVFVQQRLRSAAILKCLGATNAGVLAVYVVQVALLALGGVLLGIGVAWGVLAAVPDSLAAQAVATTGFQVVSTDLTLSAMLQGLAVGMLVSLLFALVPLLDTRHAKPLLLLRQGDTPTATGRDPVRIAATVLAGLGLVGVAAWQAASLEVGAYVAGGFIGVAGALHALGRALVRMTRPLEGARWFPLRHAALNLRRPGNQTRVVLLAVGLGSFFIIGVHAVQENLLTSFSLELRDDTPDMFLIDVQQDQADGVRRLLQEAGLGGPGDAAAPALIPVLRARVTAVTGPETSIEGRRAVRRAGFGREYTVTYRDRLEDNERIVAGEFWDAAPAGSPEVSIEDSLVERGMRLGDTVRFDVLGRIVEARVTSVRAVEWDDSRSGGFMFLFRPGTFDGAPHSYISFLRGPAEADARGALQRTLVDSYPNVSVIDGLEIIRTFRRVLDYVTLAVTVVGAIALLAGGLILVGSVAMTKFQRLFDAAVFKTLGANTRLIAVMYVFEYGVLGTLAGVVGSSGALALTWVLTRQVLDVPWTPAPAVNIGGAMVTAVVVLVVGVASSVDVLRRKPLLTLRAE
jgi:putative ABC transport system permease protein